MDRRNSLKLLIGGSASAGVLLTGCESGIKSRPKGDPGDKLENDLGYGRTPEELRRDKELLSQKYFTDREMAVLVVLSDIIIPADESSSSASEAGVPEFIEFMVKDRPMYQTPLRGGLRWMEHESNRRFGKNFVDISGEDQIAIVEDIAYPEEASENMTQGVKFFSTLRDLVVTGYFTSKDGIDYLGFKGNTPNVWDGVPEEVLAKHNVKYDEKTLRECIDQSTRNEVMDWSDYKL
ncbi:gluconate 2-dehydrogenase subunit 3 family protein [Membranihabitans maritimus]|uniref:gluconate 2-dehydrogenase subunit 3 family protein n=1 Tax=Membranihabitans maritimus TaxID=2904244 RepID=UPI001F15AF3D|nr:gluconate 2-dehydrogenase subunit 3 family protein [Membranihabitans maritimus]